MRRWTEQRITNFGLGVAKRVILASTTVAQSNGQCRRLLARRITDRDRGGGREGGRIFKMRKINGLKKLIKIEYLGKALELFHIFLCGDVY